MTRKEYTTRKGRYFWGKHATINKQLRNHAGQIIDAGEKVTILAKCKSGFEIQSETQVFMTGVNYEFVDLI